MQIETWECAECGKHCERPRTRGQRPRFCGAQCQAAAGWRRRKAAQPTSPPRSTLRRRAEATARRAAAGSAGSRVWYAGPCPVCGTAYVSHARACTTEHARGAARGARACAHCGVSFYPTGAKPAGRYCSRRCTLAVQASEMPRRSGGKWITPARRKRLYERDHYICQICHRPTDPAADSWSNAFPSLDHIVPRSRGGDHRDSNLRTAHRWCNGALSDGTYLSADDIEALAPSF
jgi:hypothetical protein